MKIELITPDIIQTFPSDSALVSLAKLNVAHDDLLVVTAKHDSEEVRSLTWSLSLSLQRQVMLVIGDNEQLAKVSSRDLKRVLKS